MATVQIIWIVVLSVGFYICGALCIFRTGMLVGWAQKGYTKHKVIRKYPFSDIVMKRWYPTYIRGAGIFIWLWALTLDYLFIFGGFR